MLFLSFFNTDWNENQHQHVSLISATAGHEILINLTQITTDVIVIIINSFLTAIFQVNLSDFSSTTYKYKHEH